MMQRPATWKVATVCSALTGLSFIGAGTAVAATHTDVIPERVMALADEADATGGNDVEARSTDNGDATQPDARLTYPKRQMVGIPAVHDERLQGFPR